jgi:hypothetical protein
LKLLLLLPWPAVAAVAAPPPANAIDEKLSALSRWVVVSTASGSGVDSGVSGGSGGGGGGGFLFGLVKQV